MDWTRAIDGYCERTDPSYWSEPLNALTNLAFLVMAVVMWVRIGNLTAGRFLAGNLFLIGVGSWLFHTHAVAWAAMADSLPILTFVLLYIYLANRDFWGWPLWVSVLGALAYVPYSAILGAGFDALPFFTISSYYWPLPVLIFGYSALLWRHSETTARNLASGAAILCVSLVARSLDATSCEAFPTGTHFVWHLLNALMLGWMIETWRLHRTSAA